MFGRPKLESILFFMIPNGRLPGFLMGVSMLASNTLQAIRHMTYRIYVRWDNQKTTHRTTTDSESVAYAAFNELASDRDNFRNIGALGIALSQDGQQIKYVQLNEGPEPQRGPRSR